MSLIAPAATPVSPVCRAAAAGTPAAVLGAGTMGSRIAAHLANAGIPSFLLDMVPAGEGSREQAGRVGAGVRWRRQSLRRSMRRRWRR